MAQATSLVAGLTDRFTAVPKTHDLVALGVSPAAISTYNALADHANNLTGECYPMIKSIARLLRRAEKTIRRHIDELIEAGLVEKLERRRDERGRFLGWLYKLPHLAAAAARIRTRREDNRKAYEERKQQQKAERKARSEERRRRRRLRKGTGTTGSSSEDPTSTTGAELDPEAAQQRKREEARNRRRRDYEWFFDPPPKERRDPEEGDDSSTPSSGHSCPLGSNKSLTSSGISIPPNPPRGAQTKEELDMKDPTSARPELKDEGKSATNDTPSPEAPHRAGSLPGRATPGRSAAPGTEGSAPPAGTEAESVSDAEAAWAAVVEALTARHKDGVPPWFGAYRLASLSGLTLTVYLADFPIRNPRNLKVGRAADLTIRGYAKELAYLWCKVAGNEDATLVLKSDGEHQRGSAR